MTECVDGAKRKIEDMPHAKKELNPLWGLLTEPLFQILAAVGLLLSGVLGLVGRLVSIFHLQIRSTVSIHTPRSTSSLDLVSPSICPFSPTCWLVLIAGIMC